MDASARPAAERRAELAAARAGHNVPATSSRDSRRWSCSYCGGEFPKKHARHTSETPGYVPYHDGPCPICGRKRP